MHEQLIPDVYARWYADTYDHIGKVQARMNEVITNISTRAAYHDISKTEEPECTGYAALQSRLADAVYGTDAYQACLDEARPTITHHYAENDHHPEHYHNGIVGMNLLSLLEMLADWKAAGERTKNGSMAQSLRVNFYRFEIDPMLFRIITRTARELEWITEAEATALLES